MIYTNVKKEYPIDLNLKDCTKMDNPKKANPTKIGKQKIKFLAIVPEANEIDLVIKEYLESYSTYLDKDDQMRKQLSPIIKLVSTISKL